MRDDGFIRREGDGCAGACILSSVTILLTKNHQAQFDVSLPTMSANDVKTFEEREEEYEKVRARIFSQQPISQVQVCALHCPQESV